MRFALGNRQFKLTFERHHRQVSVIRGKVRGTIKSRYPYTTATLFEIKDSGPIVLAHATVGCLSTDPYSHADGRKFALRALTTTLRRHNISRELRAAIWETYMNRDKQQVIETTATKVPEPVHTAGTQLALPAHKQTVAEQNGLDQRTIH